MCCHEVTPLIKNYGGFYAFRKKFKLLSLCGFSCLGPTSFHSHLLPLLICDILFYFLQEIKYGQSKSPPVRGDWPTAPHSVVPRIWTVAGRECHLNYAKPVASSWEPARPLESYPEVHQFSLHLHFLTKEAGGEGDGGSSIFKNTKPNKIYVDIVIIMTLN